jgi:uncharacterized small protein (DUF1192 family)
MTEQTKLTEQEVEKITELQNRINTAQAELGRLELTKIDIKDRRDTIESYIRETRSLEMDVAKEIEEKYGKGSINLDQKIFIANKSVE